LAVVSAVCAPTTAAIGVDRTSQQEMIATTVDRGTIRVYFRGCG